MLSKHKTRKRYLEPDAEPHERMPKSTTHRLKTARAPTPSTSTGSSTSSTSFEAQVPDCADGPEGDTCTEEECNSPEHESAQGSNHDRPFVEFVTPLGNGTSLSVGDALVLIMDYAIEVGLAWTDIEKLLKLQNRLLGTNASQRASICFASLPVPPRMTSRFTSIARRVKLCSEKQQGA